MSTANVSVFNICLISLQSRKKIHEILSFFYRSPSFITETHKHEMEQTQNAYRYALFWYVIRWSLFWLFSLVQRCCLHAANIFSQFVYTVVKSIHSRAIPMTNLQFRRPQTCWIRARRTNPYTTISKQPKMSNTSSRRSWSRAQNNPQKKCFSSL